MRGNDSYRFGISEFTTNPWSFERDVERYAAHGVDAIEVCEYKLNRDDYGPQLRRIAQARLGVSSVQTTIHSFFVDSLVPSPDDPDDRVAHIEASIRRIAAHVPQGTPFNLITGAAPHGDCARVCDFAVDALRHLGNIVAELGMRIAFEPLNPVLFNSDTALWGLDDGLALIERVAHPSVGLTCDTWNIFETPDVTSVIRACGERIFLVQVSDWRTPRSNADRRCLGDGSIPTVELLAALRSAGYARPYVVEIFSSESLPDSLWKSDLDAVIDRNIVAFERLWEESTVQA